MPNVNQIKPFEELTGAAITSSAPAAVQSGQGLPTGNMLLSDLLLGVNQSLTIGTGTTPQTDGELLLMDSVYVDTDKHGPIVENVDGLGLSRMLQFIYGTRPQTTAVAATTGNYYSGYRIPLAIPENAHALRPYDSILDLNNARMTARVQFNDLGKALGTVGTATSTPTVVWSGRLQYAPSDEELPKYVPVFKLKKVTISATQTGMQIPLDFGGLVYLGLGIAQRNSSTLAERTDVITPSAKIRLDVNGRDALLPMSLRDIQAMFKLQTELETHPPAWAFLDFYSQTGRITDCIDTVGQQGNMNLYVDVTTGTNTALWIYTWGLKPIPPTALRPSQLGQA